MGLVINTNLASLVAQQNLQVSNNQLKTNVQRLSSGFRVNSAADDAAGLARADQLKAQSVAVQAAIRNSNDGISALEIMDKSAEKVTELLVRMNDLAASAAQGTLDATTRGYYSGEYDALLLEIDRISEVTEFGNFKLLNGTTTSIDLQIGFRGTIDDRLTVATADFDMAKVAQVMQSNTGVANAAVTNVNPDSIDGVFDYNVGATNYSVSVDALTNDVLASDVAGILGTDIVSAAGGTIDFTDSMGPHSYAITAGVTTYAALGATLTADLGNNVTAGISGGRFVINSLTAGTAGNVTVTNFNSDAVASMLDTNTGGTVGKNNDTLDSLITKIDAAGGVDANKVLVSGTWRLTLTSLTAGQAITINTNDAEALGVMNTTVANDNALGVAAGDINSQAGAQTALSTIEDALVLVNNARASFGADTNRLSTTISNLQVTFTNFQAAESRIRDADFAMETASFTRNQILVQSGVSVLAQANTLPQSALTLLR